jgi:hypothetical protein
MTFSGSAMFFYTAVIVPSCVIIPIVIALVRYRSLPADLKVVCWYLFVGAAASIVSSTLAYRRTNNMPVFHIYTFLELAVLGLFYRRAFHNSGPGRIVPAVIVSFFALCVVNVVFFQHIYSYNSYTKSLEAIVIIILALLYFKKSLDQIDSKPIGTNVTIYINSGLLLYFSVSFIVFVIPNIALSKPSVFGSVVWAVHATMLLVLYLLIAVALWKYKK